MNHETAATILTGIEAASPARDGLKRALFGAAARYAHLRVEWFLADAEGRVAVDATRTKAHDAFIDSCNILSRAMASEGNSWRRLLGDDRKEIGDFACHVHASLGVRAR